KYLKFKINFFLWLKALLPALLLLIFWIALKLVLPLDFFITQSIITELLEIGFIFVVSIIFYFAFVLGFKLVPVELFKEVMNSKKKKL
ncbi:MAG: hypothetical protein PHW50_03170, partial [Patescibacteria group bacterium]|nr:hypothetical protein [Patescibacteria group bacterium]